MNEEIHSGKLIQSQMKKDGRKVKWLAVQMNRTPSDIYYLYKQPYINTKHLIEICILLRTDFCSYYSEYVRKQIRFSAKLQPIEGEIHIGKLIKNQMEKEGRNAKWLAAKLTCNRSNIYQIYKRKHLDIELLTRICIYLETDFFTYYSEYVCNQIQRKSDKL
jgi:DNA-binding Xre family transcriptional regulator